jgi:DNA polymerase V
MLFFEVALLSKNMKTEIKIIESKEFEVFRLDDSNTELPTTFINVPISAGFPNVAADHQEERIDLKKILFKHPLSTFVFRAKGNSMQEAYINTGDLIIVDTSIEPQNGDIAVCVIDEEYTLKRIAKSDGKLYLMPYNKNMKPIEVTIDNRFSIWGVLTYSIHKHNKRL